jgi:hypothetical protein
MPELDKVFPWPPYYGHFQFFEKRMQSHSQVTNLTALESGLYEMSTKNGDTLRVFVCECYSFGAAEYVETTQALGHLDVILINSAWCNYTLEAKRLCRTDKVGLFKIGDLMAALNKQGLHKYLTKGEQEAFEKNGWL